MRAKNRARPAHGGLVRAARRDALDGGRSVAMRSSAPTATSRNPLRRAWRPARRVGEPGQRLETNRLVLGAPGDAAERLLVAAEARHRGEADALALGGLGDEDELLLRGRPWQRRQRVERGKTRRLFGLERAQRDVEQDAGGLIADGLVGVGAERLGQHGHGAELADRRPPHARVAVVSSDRGQQVLFVFRNFLNARGPYRRILGLPFRLRLESVQNTHRSDVWGRARALLPARVEIDKSTGHQTSPPPPARAAAEAPAPAWEGGRRRGLLLARLETMSGRIFLAHARRRVPDDARGVLETHGRFRVERPRPDAAAAGPRDVLGHSGERRRGRGRVGAVPAVHAMYRRRGLRSGRGEAAARRRAHRGHSSTWGSPARC